jgi:hypothetical protein
MSDRRPLLNTVRNNSSSSGPDDPSRAYEGVARTSYFGTDNTRHYYDNPAYIPQNTFSGSVSSGTPRESSTRTYNFPTNTPQVPKRSQGKMAVPTAMVSAKAAGLHAGLGILGSAVGGAMNIGAAAVQTEGRKHMQDQFISNQWNLINAHSAELTKAGLPTYLAYGAYGSSSPSGGLPYSSQNISGKNNYSSSLPGNAKSSPFTGQGSQQSQGWGNVQV